MREKPVNLWPLAFCIAVSLSCSLGSQNRGSGDGQSRDGNSSNRSSDSGGSGLAGSAWKGTFKCDNGEELQANYRFAESGNPIYEYQTKSGAREVELSEPGQSFRFVPPGGGVNSIVLDSITVSPESISHTMTISHEQTSGGTLDQSSSTINSEARLSGEELDVEFTVRSQGTLSQPGIMAPGEASIVVCRGKLRR